MAEREMAGRAFGLYHYVGKGPGRIKGMWRGREETLTFFFFFGGMGF
jgi:hypothetical protein